MSTNRIHEQSQGAPLSEAELVELRRILASASVSRIGDENTGRLLIYCRRLLATLDEALNHTGS